MGMFFRRPLVFDIGFHRGEDTGYYLHRGYDVIAVDADPEMIAAGDKSFRQEIAAGRLTLLQFAICERDDDFIELNISTETLWTSVQTC
jgi:SAM-dependent methyltransferase